MLAERSFFRFRDVRKVYSTGAVMHLSTGRNPRRKSSYGAIAFYEFSGVAMISGISQPVLMYGE
jgi:hypothetical protein